MRYWKRLNTDKNINTVESYSHDIDVKGAVEINKEEFDKYIASLPKVEPEAVRNLVAEVDNLKARIEKLEQK